MSGSQSVRSSTGILIRGENSVTEFLARHMARLPASLSRFVWLGSSRLADFTEVALVQFCNFCNLFVYLPPPPPPPPPPPRCESGAACGAACRGEPLPPPGSTPSLPADTRRSSGEESDAERSRCCLRTAAQVSLSPRAILMRAALC